MCISPIFKKNPYFGADPGAHVMHDCEHQYLSIPCGHCDECLAVRQSSYIQRLTSESEYNHFFFATLTYDNKHLPVLTLEAPESSLEESFKEGAQESLSNYSLFNPDGSVCEVSLSEIMQANDARIADFECGRLESCDELAKISESRSNDQPDINIIEITYADIHHLQLMFKRMRDNNTLGRPFRYVAVTERGTKRGRPHIHIIFLIPKHPGDTVSTCVSLNEALKDMLLRFWSTNVGTRKDPVYERNFTYRERWIDGKLYRNFDCHYVNPVLTSEGVADVAYYVTKYIFKDSQKENDLKRLVFCKTSCLQEFHAVWDVVKSRCVCSKGLGLDAEFVTLPKLTQERKPLYEIAEEQRQQILIHQDLPENDFELAPVSEFRNVWKNRRVLIPNFDLVQKLKTNALKEKVSGHAIFVTYNGKHIPLAAYYRRRILDLNDFTDLYYSWDPNLYPEHLNRADNMSPDDVLKYEKRLQKKLKLIDQHEIVDSFAHNVECGRSIDPYDPYRGLSKYLNITDGKLPPKIFLGK